MKKYKIYFSDYAKNQIKQFEKWKKDHYYLKGSGIFEEKFLTKRYISDIDELIDSFLDEIFNLLQYGMGGLVIKKHKNHTEYQNIAFVKSYIIILLYNQWEEKNVIQINDIRITT